MRVVMLKFSALICFAFLTTAVFAQNSKRDLLINVGASSGYGYPSKLPGTENSGIPTLNVSADYLLANFFSAGVYVAYTYSFYKFKHPQTGYKDVWRGWDVGIISNLHLVPIMNKAFTANINKDKVDLYLSGFAGYTYRAFVYDKSNIYRNDLNFTEDALTAGGILGLRYMVNQKLGFYTEAGMSRKFFVGAGATIKM